MKYLRRAIYLIILIAGCNSGGQPKNQSIEPKTDDKSALEETSVDNTIISQAQIYFPELSDSDFIVLPRTYSVKFGTESPYKSNTIEFDLFAEIDTTGSGKITQIMIYYESDSFKIGYLEYPVFYAKDLVQFKKHPPVHFQDYNFDDFPDVAIHNREASGVKNQMYDIYLYSPDRNKYYKDRFLSEATNPSLDHETKTLTTFGQGGMASQIYSKGFYKWNNEKFVLIKNENQTYSDSLNRFIRTTKILTDSVWIIQVDTLRDEELSR